MDERCVTVFDPSGRDIHAEAALIRAAGPVSRVELPGGVRAWSVTGYEAAREVLTDHRFSKDPRQHWTDFAEGRLDPAFPMIGWALVRNLTTTFGREHSRLRRLIAKAFTPRRVEGMRETIAKTAAELLGRLDAGEAEADLKARFAHPLANTVIGDLIGIPAADRGALLAGGEANVDSAVSAEETAARLAGVQQRMRELIAERRAVPRDDLTTDLIAAQEADGSSMSDAELTGTLLLLFAVGTEPVTNLITNAASLLLRHPEARAAVAAGEVSWRDVIEEALRVESPVANLPFRFATEDVEIAGVTIPRGEPVLMGFAGIGRDPARHGATAGDFDPARADKAHLSFGYGVYRCIGMPLAVLEAELALSALFERFPGMSLAVAPEDLEPQPTFVMNGRRALPVRLSASHDQTGR